MPFEYIPCGSMEFSCELQAKDRLCNELHRSARASGVWYLLANLSFTDATHRTSSEIDFLLVCSTGVSLIEVKGWDKSLIANEPETFMRECEKLKIKSKRFASVLRSKAIDAGVVSTCMLLTKSNTVGELHFGVNVFGLNDVARLIDSIRQKSLTPETCQAICAIFRPTTVAMRKGRISKIGEIEVHPYDIQSRNTVHRILIGRNTQQNSDVDVHVFDFSGEKDSHKLTVARREADTLSILSRLPGVPRIVDSFQNASEYPGEVFYYSVERVQGTKVSVKQKDEAWTSRNRIDFCIQSLSYLEKLHACFEGKFIHRNITSDNLYVDNFGFPCFTDFVIASHGGIVTVSPFVNQDTSSKWLAPEIKLKGIASATQKSDVYSLCTCLVEILSGDDEQSKYIVEILKDGLRDNVIDRKSSRELLEQIRDFLKDEDTTKHFLSLSSIGLDDILPLNGRKYRVIDRLGSGGFSRAFRVVDLNNETIQYCAKIFHDFKIADKEVNNYTRIRPLSANNGLQTVFEISNDLARDKIHILCGFVDGTPLSAYLGSFLEYCQSTLGEDPCDVASDWCEQLLTILVPLNDLGFLHGDLSPANIIVASNQLWVLDLDSVIEEGSSYANRGTPGYSMHFNGEGKKGYCWHDVSVVATIVFSLLTNESLWDYECDSDAISNRLLSLLPSLEKGWLLTFLTKAVSADEGARFQNAIDAIAWIQLQSRTATIETPSDRVASIEHRDTFSQSRTASIETPGDSLTLACDAFIEKLKGDIALVQKLNTVISEFLAENRSKSLDIDEKSLRADVVEFFTEILQEYGARAWVGHASTVLKDLPDAVVAMFRKYLDIRNREAISQLPPQQKEHSNNELVTDHDLTDHDLWFRLSSWAASNNMFSAKARSFLYNYGRSVMRNWNTTTKQDDWAKELLDEAVENGF